MFTNCAVVPYMRMLKEVNVDYLSYDSHVFSLDSREGIAFHFSDDLLEVRDAYQKEMADTLASLFAVINARPKQIRYALPAAQLATYTRRVLEDLPITADPTCKLLILDRSIDMVSPLLHSFSYLAMLEDVLDEEVVDDTWTQQYLSADGERKERSCVLDERDPVLHQIRHMHISE